MGIQTKLILGLVIGDRERGHSRDIALYGSIDHATFGVYPIRKVRALDLLTNKVEDYSTRYVTSSKDFIGRSDKSLRLVGKSLFILESSSIYRNLSDSSYQYMIMTYGYKGKKSSVYLLKGFTCPIFHKDSGIMGINSSTISYWTFDTLKVSVDLYTYHLSIEEVDTYNESSYNRNLCSATILHPESFKALFEKDGDLYKLGSVYLIENGVRIKELVLPSDCASIFSSYGIASIDTIVFPENIRMVYLLDIGDSIKTVAVSKKMRREALNWLLMSLVAKADKNILNDVYNVFKPLSNEKIQEFVDKHKKAIDERLQSVEVVIY